MLRLLFLVLLALPLAAAAQSVALQGVLGSKALLIVEGGAPKAVPVGDTHAGVKVLSVLGDQAVLEFGGKRHTLRVGESQASVGGGGPASRGSRIVLPVGSGGHFSAQGTINGKSVQFLVDTGATTVAMGLPTAERLGIDYKAGQPSRSMTANGVVATWRVRLASVRIGDVEVYDVEGSVLAADMPIVLLGNTFLSRFQMTRANDQLVLERRY